MINKFNNMEEFLSFVENQKRVTNKQNLNDMYAFAEVLGNPQKGINFVHVTGTNGKGSVVQYLKEMFLIHGLKVGTFTSPYIEKFNERITVNSKFISDKDTLRLANLILDNYPKFYELTNTYPSFFEFITLLAFLYFKEQKVDVVVLEVGIGGLLDSTNIVDSITSVISNVSYDHMNILGNTLEEILHQKLGIVKKNQPCIIGIKDEKLLKLAELECLEKNAKLIAPLFTAIEIKKCDELGSEFVLEGFGEIKIKMLGKHQIENAVVALYAFIEAYPLIAKKNYDVTLIKKALLNTFWLGRLEIVKEKPFTIIDGGHNIDGINRVCEFIKTLNYHTKRCIFSCSSNKEKFKMLNVLKETFDEIIITEFTYKRHNEAKELFDAIDMENKLLLPSIDDAIDYVNNHPFDLNLYIGSLYFVSEIRPKLLS